MPSILTGSRGQLARKLKIYNDNSKGNLKRRNMLPVVLSLSLAARFLLRK